MSKPKMSTDLIAQSAHAFIGSEFGRWYLATLEEQYDMLIFDAKNPGSAEFKAFCIERAAGVEIAIELLKGRASEHDPRGGSSK